MGLEGWKCRRTLKGDDLLRTGQVNQRCAVWALSLFSSVKNPAKRMGEAGGFEGQWEGRTVGERGRREGRGGLERVQGNSRLLLPNMLSLNRGWETGCCCCWRTGGRGTHTPIHVHPHLLTHTHTDRGSVTIVTY